MFILQLLNDKTADWFEINDAGEVISRQHFSEISQCPKVNPDANLIVLYPGEKISIVTAKLPKMRASEKLQAIPFVIEEQLADNPEAILVTVGDTNTDGATIIGVTDKAAFETQITALHDANLYPRSLIPDFLALSWEAETWSVLVQNQMAIVRTDFQNGFSVDAQNLLFFLELQLTKTKKPTKIICWQENNIIDQVAFEKLHIPIEIRCESKYGYFDAKNLSIKPPLNFLQGKYRPKTQSSDLRKNWMMCATSGAALITFLFLSQIAQWIYFQHQAIALENKVTEVYRTLFPNSKDVLEPHFRTASLLKKYTAAAQDSEFLKVFGIAGKTVLAFPSIHTQSIQFENHQLTLTVNAKNVDVLSEWSQSLRAQDMQVSQRVLSTAKDNLSAEMTVKENS